MTVSLVRHLHRNVTKPILRAKHDLLRSVGLAKPSRSASTAQEPEWPATAAAGSTTPAATTRSSDAPTTAAPTKASKAKAAPTKAKAKAKAKPTSKPAGTASSRTKADLYEQATRKGVEGRSKMTKAELAKALGLG